MKSYLQYILVVQCPYRVNKYHNKMRGNACYGALYMIIKYVMKKWVYK